MMKCIGEMSKGAPKMTLLEKKDEERSDSISHQRILPVYL